MKGVTRGRAITLGAALLGGRFAPVTLGAADALA
jgi:hypothetical protein